MNPQELRTPETGHRMVDDLRRLQGIAAKIGQLGDGLLDTGLIDIPQVAQQALTQKTTSPPQWPWPTGARSRLVG
jgi:hypothetical protein